MAEQTTVVGVDFSGAQTDNRTWITRAELTVDTQENCTLEIRECAAIRRADLAARLNDLPDGAVAALDFPFSVPIAFADYWGQSSAEMPKLWGWVASMSLEQFIEKRNRFVGDDKTREYLRIGDLHCSGAFSCLHDTQPNMLPMTFYGMNMLHQLRQRNRFAIPPLPSAKAAHPVLLEVMPGAALTAYRLLPAYRGYKSIRNRDAARAKRSKIFKRLPAIPQSRFAITGDNLNQVHEQCRESDDCLDSVVAATVAALWAMDKDGAAFRQPTDDSVTALRRPNSRRQASPQIRVENLTERQAAKREGWIYMPLAAEGCRAADTPRLPRGAV